MKPILIDAHQDLAWNMLTFGRDYSLSAHQTRQHENGSLAVEKNDQTLLGWPDYHAGRVALVFSTLFAAPVRASEGDWDTEVYRDHEQAYRLYKKQVDAYARLFDRYPDKFTPVRSTRHLASVIDAWQNPAVPAPTGLLTLMEGADGIRSVDELDEWWHAGVRIIGLAWKATRYCGGTGEPGSLTREGRSLLSGMAERGFMLDISHMSWEAALEALERYEGIVLASHANPLKMLKGETYNRFLTDEILDSLFERDGVVGIVPYNRFLDRNWRRGDALPLERVVDHIDYICQRAGDARHVGIGSDFDGGFGLGQVPDELDTIADLQKLVPLLAARGYTEDDIVAIMGRNWQSILEKGLPDE